MNKETNPPRRTELSLPTAEEIKTRRKPKRNINEQHEESLSLLERVAVWITDHVGTMGFFLIILAWTVGWLGWNYAASAAADFTRPGSSMRPGSSESGCSSPT